MPTTLTDGVVLLERAMSYTLDSLRLITPQFMNHGTPCRSWDLRALLWHMNDSLLTLHEAIASGQVGFDPEHDIGDPAVGDYGDTGTEPVTTLRNRAYQMIGAWASAPGRETVSIADRVLPSGIVAATGALEVAVHGWDVSRACGRRRPIPSALAAELLGLCPLLVTDDDRPARFADCVDTSRLAGPSDRLVARLGRCPDGPAQRCSGAGAAGRRRPLRRIDAVWPGL